MPARRRMACSARSSCGATSTTYLRSSAASARSRPTARCSRRSSRTSDSSGSGATTSWPRPSRGRRRSARESGTSNTTAGPTTTPEFDRDETASLAAEAREHAAAWRTWFDAHAIDPFEVTYEELEATPVEVARRALGFLGLPSRSVEIRELTARQRDAVNAEWVRRFAEGEATG